MPVVKAVNELLDCEYSIGMIGGKNKKAYYFVGRADYDYLLLDPHRVQAATNSKNIFDNLNTYFCKHTRRVAPTSISSQVTLAFYLRDLQDLENFHQLVCKLTH
jgi:hypothetical protein